MELSNLPHTTKVQRVIPKNAFDSYTTSKQRKLFTDLVARITWSHKLAPETINLEAKEIKEIQVFRIELKMQEEIQPLLDVMDRAIPYQIVFLVIHGENMYISTSSKHIHPVNEDNAVIDYTFKTDWFHTKERNFTFNLSRSIDAVYHDFCLQLSGAGSFAKKSMGALVEYSKQVDYLNKEIEKLKSSITSSKQFNHKVELNIRLKDLEKQLKSVIVTT
jgi:hypothetical protein